MKTLVRFACVAFVAVALPGAAFAKAKCVKAGGEGSGVGQEMAKFMANAALNQSISAMGGKAKGAAKVTCSDVLLVSTCKAEQTACK